MTLQPKTILLIHGQWLTPRSWEFFHRYFEERGYRVLAPAWPRLGGEVEDVRRDPRALAGLGLREIVDHYEHVARHLGEPAVLIGHALGGLVVQILLDRGWGAAGVAINSVVPQGVLRVPLSTIKATWRVIADPRNYWRAIALTYDQFRDAFAQSMPEEEARAAYDRYVIAGPGRTVFQAALARLNPWDPSRVDFQNPERAPLLLMAGADDRLISVKLSRANFQQYAYSTAVTELKEFANGCHLMIAQAGWQEVAECALGWVQTQLRRAAARDWQRGGTRRRSSATL